tara:strand:- start:1144 stop:3108 length:1965 start_codon:yes stop_codon:yes gene_type:complete
MKYRTCFSSISQNGYKLDILKSGMQKYLRRKQFGDMVWCAYEIYKFELYACTEKQQKACNAIITNLINRIIVMMDEELLFAETERYIVLREMIEKFQENRKSSGETLILMCKCLVEGRISRRNSDLRSWWSHRIINEDYGLDDTVYFERFVECFERKDDECFKWMFKIFKGEKKGDTVRYRRKDNIYMVWEYLFDTNVVKANSVYKKVMDYKLNEFFKLGRGERFMFLCSCIDMAMKCNTPEDKSREILSNLRELYVHGRWIDADLLKKCNEYIQIDDYCIDMHTSQGRKMGKNKADFAKEGCVVVDEDKEFYVREWRDYYIQEKLDNPIKIRKKKSLKNKKTKKKEENKKENKKEKKKGIDKFVVNVKSVKAKSVSQLKREEKTKRIKKMRPTPVFSELEDKLPKKMWLWMDSTQKLCGNTTCGNKVMCFKYKDTIWKESRKSMNYNRDYCVLDKCKPFFGLNSIGMKRILSDFRVEKISKETKYWADNWEVTVNGEKEGHVVYCVMDEITPGTEVGKMKAELLNDRRLLKEFAKIGIVRGIFRVSDFNGRNVLVKEVNGRKELVSIDEGDIGKRVDIIGRKNRWLMNALNKDNGIVYEILNEVDTAWKLHSEMISSIMMEYKFTKELFEEVRKNYNNLLSDLVGEGFQETVV